MFKDFPDIVTVSQLQNMLGGISKKLAYKLINQDYFTYKKIGREYRITKNSVINYILKESA